MSTSSQTLQQKFKQFSLQLNIMPVKGRHYRQRYNSAVVNNLCIFVLLFIQVFLSLFKYDEDDLWVYFGDTNVKLKQIYNIVSCVQNQRRQDEQYIKVFQSSLSNSAVFNSVVF
ncbi:Hypothetical_protein [Hexamita inflata]|uniref:Hypothetical_protein n=1 Tax=Hexamita inflata TaxID=28002 RepID=A0AA86Q194_9EUKA|nr:Hypothetical protein HINF_LOCUS17132 [Hexamita inflata]CAI9950279.1 Hypothetical protein HINF_LOCUS37924 [Hexamita inflata]